jgi:hypothetical protein
MDWVFFQFFVGLEVEMKNEELILNAGNFTNCDTVKIKYF